MYKYALLWVQEERKIGFEMNNMSIYRAHSVTKKTASQRYVQNQRTPNATY